MPFWKAEEQTQPFALAHVNWLTGCAGPVQWYRGALVCWGSFGGFQLPLLPQPEEALERKVPEFGNCSLYCGWMYLFFFSLSFKQHKISCAALFLL